MYYLIVNCGYTSRLIRHYENMIYKPIYIYDDLCGDGLTDFENCTKYDVDQCGLENGIIVFKFDGISCIDIVKHLQSFDHCGMFSFDNHNIYDDDGNEIEKDDPNFDNRRMITNDDIKNFDVDSEIYYCGTLDTVNIIKKDNDVIYTLEFDTESG